MIKRNVLLVSLAAFVAVTSCKKEEPLIAPTAKTNSEKITATWDATECYYNDENLLSSDYTGTIDCEDSNATLSYEENYRVTEYKFTFNANGTWSNKYFASVNRIDRYNSMMNCEVVYTDEVETEENSGSWTIAGDELTLMTSFGDTMKSTILELTSTKFRMIANTEADEANDKATYLYTFKKR